MPDTDDKKSKWSAFTDPNYFESQKRSGLFANQKYQAQKEEEQKQGLAAQMIMAALAGESIGAGGQSTQPSGTGSPAEKPFWGGPNPVGDSFLSSLTPQSMATEPGPRAPVAGPPIPGSPEWDQMQKMLDLKKLANEPTQRAMAVGWGRSQTDPNQMDQSVSPEEKLQNEIISHAANYAADLEKKQGASVWEVIGGIGLTAAGFATAQPWLVALGSGLQGHGQRNINEYNELYQNQIDQLIQAHTQENQAIQQRLSAAINDLTLMVRGADLSPDDLNKAAEAVGGMRDLPPDAIETIKQMAPNLARVPEGEKLDRIMQETRLLREQWEMEKIKQGEGVAKKTAKDTVRSQLMADLQGTEDVPPMERDTAVSNAVAAAQAAGLDISVEEIEATADQVLGRDLSDPPTMKERENFKGKDKATIPTGFTPVVMKAAGSVNMSPDEASVSRDLHPNFKKMPPFNDLTGKASYIQLGDAVADYIAEHGEIRNIKGIGKTLAIPARLEERDVNYTGGKSKAPWLQRTVEEPKDYIPVFAFEYSKSKWGNQRTDEGGLDVAATYRTKTSDLIWIQDFERLGEAGLSDQFKQQLEWWMRGVTMRPDFIGPMQGL